MYATYPHAGATVALIPVPPSEKSPVPSRRPQQRNNFVARNNIATASAVEHACATRIAATWRGYALRRHLASRNITHAFQVSKATKIQCFVRVTFARRIAQFLRARRLEWIHARAQVYEEVRLRELAASIKWQRAVHENAAVKIQRVYRWRLQKRWAAVEGSNSAESPPPDSPPGMNNKRSYMPTYWRRRSSVARAELLITANPSPRNDRWRSPDDNKPASAMTASLPQMEGGQLALYDGRGGGQQQRNNLVLYHPQPPSKRFTGPPSQQEVESINEQNRAKEHQLALLLESESQQSRIRDRVDGIVQQDHDHCAGVLQRRFRIIQAKQSYHSRQCLAEYVTRYATVIQCAFRSYIARVLARQHRRAVVADVSLATRKYAAAQVDRLKVEYVWNASRMRRAAIVIQSAYRRCKYLQRYNSSKHGGYNEYAQKGPKALPLGILRDEGAVGPAHRSAGSTDGKQAVFRRHRAPQRNNPPPPVTVVANIVVDPPASEGKELFVGSPTDILTPSTTPTSRENNTTARRAMEESISSRNGFGSPGTPGMAVLDDNAVAVYPEDTDDTELKHVDGRTASREFRSAVKIQCMYRQHAARALAAARKRLKADEFERAQQDEAARKIQSMQRRRRSVGPTCVTPTTSNADALSLTPSAAPVARSDDVQAPATEQQPEATDAHNAAPSTVVDEASSVPLVDTPTPPTTSETEKPSEGPTSAPEPTAEPTPAAMESATAAPAPESASEAPQASETAAPEPEKPLVAGKATSPTSDTLVISTNTSESASKRVPDGTETFVLSGSERPQSL